MKKKLKDETKWFPSAILYRPDLESIRDIFIGCCPKFQISDDEYEYDSLEELETKRGQVIKKLTIESESPKFSLTVSGGRTELARGGWPMILGPYTEIQQLLKSRRRTLLYAFFNPVTTITASVIIFVGVGMTGSHLPTITAVPIALVIAGMLLVMFRNFSGGFTKIVLIQPHEQKSFLVQNRDAIVVGVIVSLLTAGLSFLVAYLLFRQGIK